MDTVGIIDMIEDIDRLGRELKRLIAERDCCNECTKIDEGSY